MATQTRSYPHAYALRSPQLYGEPLCQLHMDFEPGRECHTHHAGEQARHGLPLLWRSRRLPVPLLGVLRHRSEHRGHGHRDIWEYATVTLREKVLSGVPPTATVDYAVYTHAVSCQKRNDLSRMIRPGINEADANTRARRNRLSHTATPELALQYSLGLSETRYRRLEQVRVQW